MNIGLGSNSHLQREVCKGALCFGFTYPKSIAWLLAQFRSGQAVSSRQWNLALKLASLIQKGDFSLKPLQAANLPAWDQMSTEHLASSYQESPEWRRHVHTHPCS